MEINSLSKILDVKICENNMIAKLCLLPNSGEEHLYELEDVLNYIDSAGVTFGVSAAEIQNMIDKKIYGQEIIIANGQVPVMGKNGYYDFKFDINPDLTPKIREDGTTDYLNLELFQNVAEGQILCRYIPKIEGKEGTNVKGDKIPCGSALDMPPLNGKGFILLEDGVTYVSQYNGKVEYSPGRLTVQKVHVVAADVSMETGNVDFYGDVEIAGDVKSGLKVKATGNIVINGLVEGATIEAGRNILIKGGIVGNSRAMIKANDSVLAQFVEMANVNAGEMVNAGYILHSKITAGTQVVVLGKSASIIGGEIHANNLIRTKVIGNYLQTKTILSVGIEDFIINNQNKILTDIKEAEADLEKIEKTIQLLEVRMMKMSEPNQETDNLRLQLIRTKIDKNAYISKQRATFDEVKRRISLITEATIIAERQVYPGVVIKIDSAFLELLDAYESIVFSRKGKWILTKKFNVLDYQSGSDITQTISEQIMSEIKVNEKGKDKESLVVQEEKEEDIDKKEDKEKKEEDNKPIKKKKPAWMH